MARFVFALLVVVLFIQFETTNHAFACAPEDLDCKPCLRPGSEPGKETYNRSPDVTNIELGKSELKIKKRDDPDKPPAYDSEFAVDVKVTAEDPEQDVMTYNYSISGGRIVGTGAKVRWDLNGVMPGTYTITAGVDDGCGICGKTAVQSVVIVQD